MVDWFYFRVFFVPILALLTPGLMLAWRVSRNKLQLALTRKTVVRFSLVWFILSMAIFTLLLYLTSGILTAFRLEKSFNVSDRDIQWNATEHLRVIFVYDPGVSLLVISFLSGLLYASLLTLPKVCTIIDKAVKEEDIRISGASTSVSSISATMSAFASSAVCCSTSVIAVIAPSVSIFLGPFVPGLLIISFLLLIYSFRSIVMPRFAIPSTIKNPGFITV